MLCYRALYTGVTSDLAWRVWEHRTGAVAGFTKRYGLKVLVWYEPRDHGSRDHARKTHQGVAARLEDQAHRADLYDELNR